MYIVGRGGRDKDLLCPIGPLELSNERLPFFDDYREKFMPAASMAISRVASEFERINVPPLAYRSELGNLPQLYPLTR